MLMTTTSTNTLKRFSQGKEWEGKNLKDFLFYFLFFIFFFRKTLYSTPNTVATKGCGLEYLSHTYLCS